MEAEGDFLTDKGEILSELTNSKIHQNAIGIACDKLGNGIFITVVDQIVIGDYSTTIILRPFDATGVMFPTNKIELEDITSVFPFKSKFINPFIHQSKPEDVYVPMNLFEKGVTGESQGLV